MPHGGQSYCIQTGRVRHIHPSLLPEAHPAPWEAAQRGDLVRFFSINQGNEKNTDGIYSLRERWKLIARKGEGVGINVNYI